MASSVDIRVGVLGLREFAASMGVMGNKAYDRSQRKAVTQIARGYFTEKTAKVAQDIDRPTPFTRRGFDWDRAPRTGDIYSRAFVRPKQAQYLEIIEEGGTRSHTGDGGPTAPKPNVTDRFGGLFGRGGIKKRFFDRASQPTGTFGGRRTYATGARRFAVLKLRDGRTGRQIYGVFEKRKMGKKTTKARRAAGRSAWRTRLIVRFVPQATYRPQLHFVDDARTYARQRFPMLSLTLFNEELRRALQQ